MTKPEHRPKPPKVIIGIVGYQCATILHRLVRKCDELTFPNAEIHICENGGAAAFEELSNRLDSLCPAGLVVREEALPARTRQIRRGRTASGRALVLYEAGSNLGYSGGINVVLAGVSSDPDWTAFWILNPDALPQRGALLALNTHLEQGHYGATGARLVFSASGTIQQYGGRWRWWLGRGLNVGYGAAADAAVDVPAIEREITYISGACLLASRAYVEAVGPMDERYFLFSEEVDWCLRRRGFRLGYCHEAIVLHDHGATIGSSREMSARSAFSVYLLERSGLLLTRKFRPLLLPVVVIASGLYVFRYLSRGGWPQFKAAALGWLAGVLGETGFPPRFLPPGGRR